MRRIRNYLRHPRTKREMKFAVIRDDEEFEGFIVDTKRLVRKPFNSIPTLWDDQWRELSRSWKKYRKKQWKKKADNSAF